MELNFKKTIAVLLSGIIITTAAAEPFFEGFAGASLDMNLSDDFIPGVYLQGDVAGRLEMNDSVSFKGDFQFTTSDIITHGLFQTTPSSFSIRELSAAFTLYGHSSIMQITTLLGEQTPFGSDAFVRKALGIRNYSSTLLTRKTASGSAGMALFPGMGISFTDTFGSSALGIYCFYDINDTNDTSQINSDFQYAFNMGNTILNVTAGATLPVETSQGAGGKLSVSIRKLAVRTDISTLFSISDRVHLFFQAGTSGLSILNNTDFRPESLYLFAEPRISLPVCNLNISFFCLSDETLKELTLITKPIGCNLDLQTLPFLLLQHTATAGINAAACSPRTVTPDTQQLDVIIAPYLEHSLSSGILNTSAVFHPLDYSDTSKFCKISISYKAQF